MRKIFLLSLLSFSFYANAQSMFRGKADHASFIKSNNANLFGEEDWRFDAKAAVRSTAVCSGNAIFFGASSGIFYSLDKQTGNILWQYNTGHAINSSPALYNINIFFSDNKQTLYSLNAKTGKLNWKFDFDKSLDYEWAFDYYYSSPTISGQSLLIGGKDGNVYNINALTGKVIWKFKAGTIVRSTPSIADNKVYFGDVNGTVYAIQLSNGKELWRFAIEGNKLNNEDFGFDRRAIIASPVITKDKVVVGGRDGFLYGIDKNSGKEIWRMDHEVSWVISSVAVKDSFVITGTSDGRFVQAVNLNTGKQIWKYRTPSIVWSSPVIENDKVYVGSHAEVLYCLDLYTGKKINGFQASGVIFSSPVICNDQLFFGTDKGYVYCLKRSLYKYTTPENLKKFVFWEPNTSIYFNNGTDIRIRDYLRINGYKLLNSKTLAEWFTKDSALNSVIVFASNYFPKSITDAYQKSLLRNYLDKGGKVVVLGINPLIFQTDTATKAITGRNFLFPDSIINVNYGYKDLRAMKGTQPAFPTNEGIKWGLRRSWVALLSLPLNKVDIVLGTDENGLASAWVKKFHQSKGSGFVQLWVDANGVEDMSFITRVAEYGY